MSNTKKGGVMALALAAVMMLAVCTVLIAPYDSDATGDDLSGYGTVNEITIAQGYSWSYTATFPSDLTAGVVLSFQTNELGSVATINGHTLSINGITESHAGNKYNIVLKAVHADSEQTSYQWIRITVNNAMSVSHSGCINEIIKGATQTIQLTSSGGIGTVTWSAVSLPAGLTLSGSTVSGTPSTVGLNTVEVQATSDKGESIPLSISFTVYNKILGGSDETINAIGGKSVSSTAVTQTGSDLNVTWSVTSGTIPAGLTLDSSTGKISGTYTGTTKSTSTVTLTGTAQNGPSQTATKKVTINAEPAFTLSGNSKLVTFTGNATAKTIAFTQSTTNTSTVTWSVSPTLTGVSISNGTVSVAGTAAVTSGTTVTVKATTQFGQAVTKTFTLVVEDTLRISGDTKLVSTQGVSKTTAAYTISGGSTNTFSISNYGGISTSALTCNTSAKTISISSAAIIPATDVTLTVTSEGGQTATCTLNVQVFSTIGFTSAPSASGIFAVVRS